MLRFNALFSQPQYYSEHLGEKKDHKKIIREFEPANENGYGLVDYLQHWAFDDEVNNDARTYLVRQKGTKELVGYFTLKAGAINQYASESGRKSSIPGIELVNFAVNGAYKKKHPEIYGVGRRILYTEIMTRAQAVQAFIGAKILYIFALPYESLLNYYKSVGFRRLSEKNEAYIHKTNKPTYDDSCIFMYQLL